LSSLPSEPRMPSSLRRRSQRIPAMLQAESNMEINDIPFPDWSLIDLSNRLKVLPLETSRGCPYQCAYFSETLFWGKPVRYKEISKVVAEIINDVRRFNINTFRIVDSCFSSPANRCAELCDAIHDRCIKKGMDIHWTSYARLNNLSESLLKKMKNAGCVALDVGWESGDPEIAARMGKHYDPKALVDVMRTAKERNIIINCNVLIGFPGETEETINKTAELIEQAQPDTYTCFMLFVAPHTRLWENRSQFGLEGIGLYWKHATMDSSKAQEIMNEKMSDIASSILFPGGEYFSCYLTSMGFEVNAIKDFFAAIKAQQHNAATASQKELIHQVDNALNRYL